MGASESTSRSNGTKENEEEPNQENNSSMATATAVATAAAGVAFAAWGISKMLSDNTDTEETNQPSLVNSPRIAYEAINQRSLWSPPPGGRFKMNTDGACRPRDQVIQRGPTGYGGILRDHCGNWIWGFIGFIDDEADALTSEFYGILKGLELLDKLKLQGSILETDNQAAYQWVTRQGDSSGKSVIVNERWHIITECRKLIGKNNIDVMLVKGDNANRCADKLADMGIARGQAYVEFKECPDELKYVEFKECPDELKYLVDADRNG